LYFPLERAVVEAVGQAVLEPSTEQTELQVQAVVVVVLVRQHRGILAATAALAS
jgi:hypothetical protein